MTRARWATTLWDLFSKPLTASRPRPRTHSIVAARAAKRPARNGSMQAKYDALVEEMKQLHGIKVRKWRKSSSGVAWTIQYVATGKIVKLIESPYPRGPMSCAIFLHEVGHHAIGLGVHKPRCLEEYRVWVWALQTMRDQGFNVTPAVERRMERSMQYAVAKARRRGLKVLPAVLAKYL